jgi:MFS family permease
MKSSTHPMRIAIDNRNFRLLWIGQVTSLLGDQFDFIAMPWLVLQMTGDPLVLGTVLGLAGIPRALFMLYGGAITDRFSARNIMIISDLIRLGVVAAMAVLVWSGAMQTWMLYFFALLFGCVSGFFMPASSAMVPKISHPEALQASNSLMQGSSQLTNFIGPALAGGLIALFSDQTGTTPPGQGIALAFAIDALTFLVSVGTLLAMDQASFKKAPAHTPENVWQSIRSGVRFVWTHLTMRLLFLVIAIANLLFLGPLLVGMPVLADQKMAEGAAAYGLMMSAYAGGNLIGIILSGVLPRPKPALMDGLTIGLIFCFGLVMASFGLISNTWLAFGLLLAMGIGNGYLAIALITYIQRHTPGEMLGRVMSLVYLANLGLAPVSQAVSGAVISLSLTGLFLGSGVLLFGTAIWMFFTPAARSLGAHLVGLEE